ncbi:MAG TPA: glycosyltransferase, partial [Burkholderiaceae bacterium]|nr:glycosyltransferase [Burkholderiaceae bacterium]
TDIRSAGDGRFLVTGGAVFFSSTKNATKRPRSVWMVKQDSRTRPRLPFASEVVAPLAFECLAALWPRLRAAIDAETGTQAYVPLRRGDTVVVLTHALPPGGAERQWCYLAGDLKRMGYNVEFVTLFRLEGDDKHYLPLLASDGVKLTELAQQKVEPQEALAAVHSALDGIMSTDAAAGVRDPFGQHLRDLVDLFVRLKPRVVFAQLDYCNVIAAAAGLLTSAPQIVLSFRNYNPSSFSYLANDWFQPLYALLAQSPSVVLTGNSRAANVDYARWIGVDERRVKLVPNAIDAGALAVRHPEISELRKQFALAPGTPVVLGVFRLNEEKRPVLFVETFAAVVARVPSARAFVAGVGPLEQAMRQRITELNLQTSLTLLGRRDDVLELMGMSSLLLLTSNFEGMPNVVMEAQAVGIPVVAPDVGGVSDCMIDGKTGYVVDRDDVGAFSRRCIELLEDDELRARFGAAGALHVRHSFSRRAMAERYVEVLTSGSDVSGKTFEPFQATAA